MNEASKNEKKIENGMNIRDALFLFVVVSFFVVAFSNS
jgi:hypothetical protein